MGFTCSRNSRIEPEHMAHIVCARTLSCGPYDGLKGTRGKCLAALRAVRQLDALDVACEHDRVIAHDRPAAARCVSSTRSTSPANMTV